MEVPAGTCAKLADGYVHPAIELHLDVLCLHD